MVTARGIRNGQWLTLERIETEFYLAADILRGKGISVTINPIRVGVPGLELLVRDEDGNIFKFSAFHGGSQGTLLCFGRSQRFDVVTGKNIAQAFLRRI